MKTLKIALLGTAALAAVSISARADELSDLKAQIAALDARVASVESTPSIPAGYEMVSFSKIGNDHVISIMPTADVPASTTITWAGNVRAAIVAYGSGSYYNDKSVDVVTHAGLSVKGTTDTAVGEVGAKIGIKAIGLEHVSNYNGGQSYLQTDHFVGWWKLTPNVTLSGGNSNSVQSGSLSKNSYQFDSVCSCYEIDYNGSIYNNPIYNDVAQMALAYADGPLGFAVALEDGPNSGNNSAFGVAAKATYKSDTFGFDLSGGYWGNPSGGDATWNVNAGVGGKFDIVSLGVSVGTGHEYSSGWGYYDFTRAGGYANVALGSSASLELGIAHDFGDTTNNGAFGGTTTYSGGLYYTPVSKLVVGLEGEYTTGGYYTDGRYVADLVTVFNF